MTRSWRKASCAAISRSRSARYSSTGCGGGASRCRTTSRKVPRGGSATESRYVAQALRARQAGGLLSVAQHGATIEPQQVEGVVMEFHIRTHFPPKPLDPAVDPAYHDGIPPRPRQANHAGELEIAWPVARLPDGLQ